ncbi:YcgN family cysteine cluster protein [Saccharibacter sp. 17.LH.SD]|uniref:YcgN family cysteine cluster protein n=1 Tax=Saccharibacter sp. 17.LH.SD TaxID=2689393 RepID=UPI00136A6A21|nr:YcgN family cysteine cluster protein [Saccharibacter sp. 17.LH.SD]MXV43777.1 YcgN family cysteine cluster protein [Saccharibacter sp. 17.LH.SD]
MTSTPPFWKTTPLADMTQSQWESLCDGCGRCCLHKLRDEETDEIIWTDISCRLLDTQTCLCTDYHRRQRRIPDCISLTPALLRDIDWLPPSCAYRLLRDGFDLPDWHPLVSGSQDTVHTSGASARGRCLNERYAGMIEDHQADWPGEWPDHAPPCTNSLKNNSK